MSINITYLSFNIWFVSQSKAGKLIFQSTSSRRGETAKPLISWKPIGRGASTQPPMCVKLHYLPKITLRESNATWNKVIGRYLFGQSWQHHMTRHTTPHHHLCFVFSNLFGFQFGWLYLRDSSFFPFPQTKKKTNTNKLKKKKNYQTKIY